MPAPAPWATVSRVTYGKNAHPPMVSPLSTSDLHVTHPHGHQQDKELGTGKEGTRPRLLPYPGHRL